MSAGGLGFWLGSRYIESRLVLAPMAGATNPPFRRLCREQGAGLVVTEMASARGIVTGDARTWALVDLQPVEEPVAVQLFGCDPSELAEAARLVEEAGADAVDVNMGCPMRKVVNTGRGAALLREPKKVEAIVAALSAAVAIPVTAKIRAGWEDSNAVDVASALENGGAAGLAIHGRTRAEGYEHHVDLEVIAAVKAAVSIPVIGNGDVRDRASCARMFDETGCDAVMIARGCLGNPWIFADLSAFLSGSGVASRRTPESLGAMVRRHLALYVEAFGERQTCLEFRKHLLWYFRGTPAFATARSCLDNLWNVDALEAAVDAAVECLARVRLEHPDLEFLPDEFDQ